MQPGDEAVSTWQTVNISQMKNVLGIVVERQQETLFDTPDSDMSKRISGSQ